MRPITLSDVAEALPVQGEAKVIKPHWLNPAVEGGKGSGLEFKTKLTLAQLLGEYRDQIIKCAFAAQFLLVTCEPGPDDAQWKVKTLDHHRPDGDMYWHTDIAQRNDRAITVIDGVSSVKTGVQAKTLAATAIANHRNDPAVFFRHKNSQRAMALVEPERLGLTKLYEDTASQYLGELHDHVMEPEVGYALKNTIDQFWRYIQDLQIDSDVFWMGDGSVDPPPKLILSRNVYHCKQYTPRHDYPRDGNKRRIDVYPSAELIASIDTRFAKLTHSKPEPVDADWLHKA
jgi:hypothetical protein